MVGDISGYKHKTAELRRAHRFLLPSVCDVIENLSLSDSQRRVFDLGCGNGAVAHFLSQKGYDVVGVDPSSEGLEQAKRAYPNLKLFSGSAYDDLQGRFGQFPIVLSLEVVEHIYFPRKYAACIYSLLEDGGVAVISTPYHGYWKNLLLALTGTLDAHFSALWDYGHIKFWSVRTLTHLLAEAGFSSIHFRSVGRIPPFARSMIAIARK